MAENLIPSVTREIDRLKKEIGQRTSELAALKDNLIRYQRVYGLLGDGDTSAQRPGRRRGRARRTTPVNWNSVLDQLPSRFTVEDLAKEAVARRKSPSYVRQVAMRWARRVPKSSAGEVAHYGGLSKEQITRILRRLLFFLWRPGSPYVGVERSSLRKIY